MAILKDLIVQGTSRFLNNVTGTNITADSFVKSGGTSAQFLKADGSVDSNTYATTSSLGSYLPLTGGTLTGALGIPGTSTASDTTKGINFTYSTSTGHIGMSTALGIYSSGSIIMRPNGASSSATGSGSLTLSSSGITAEQTITAEGFKKSGGTSAQFLKADGSVDSNSYVTTTVYNAHNHDDLYLKLSGGTMSNTTVVTNLNADLLDGVHIGGINPKVIYNAGNGVLIKTDLASAGSRMIYVEITGNSYGSGNKLPVHTLVNFYDYTAAGGIIGSPSAINMTNQCIESINVFRYDGKVCIWFSTAGSYMTWYVVVRTQGDSVNHAGTLSNVAMPDSGVEFLTTVVPKQNIIESDELTTNEINTICV